MAPCNKQGHLDAGLFCSTAANNHPWYALHPHLPASAFGTLDLFVTALTQTSQQCFPPPVWLHLQTPPALEPLFPHQTLLIPAYAHSHPKSWNTIVHAHAPSPCLDSLHLSHVHFQSYSSYSQVTISSVVNKAVVHITLSLRLNLLLGPRSRFNPLRLDVRVKVSDLQQNV